MEEQLITYDTAKLASEKGFNVPCHHGYRKFEEGHKWNGQLRDFNNFEVNGISHVAINGLNFPHVVAPSQAVLQKWLREEKSIIVNPRFVISTKGFIVETCYPPTNGWSVRNCDHIYKLSTVSRETYEIALEEGLLEALKLI